MERLIGWFISWVIGVAVIWAAWLVFGAITRIVGKTAAYNKKVLIFAIIIYTVAFYLQWWPGLFVLFIFNITLSVVVLVGVWLYKAVRAEPMITAVATMCILIVGVVVQVKYPEIPFLVWPAILVVWPIQIWNSVDPEVWLWLFLTIACLWFVLAYGIGFINEKLPNFSIVLGIVLITLVAVVWINDKGELAAIHHEMKQALVAKGIMTIYY